MLKAIAATSVLILATLTLTTTSDARPRHHHRHSYHHHRYYHHHHHARRHHHRPSLARRAPDQGNSWRFVRDGFRAFGRPAAWCGWWLGQQLGMTDRRLWTARNWASVGSSSGGPRVGAVVVWPHHVGIITGRAGNKWVVKSGNDGHRVRERPRDLSRAIAFRSV